MHYQVPMVDRSLNNFGGLTAREDNALREVRGLTLCSDRYQSIYCIDSFILREYLT